VLQSQVHGLGLAAAGGDLVGGLRSGGQRRRDLALQGQIAAAAFLPASTPGWWQASPSGPASAAGAVCCLVAIADSFLSAAGY
jgi:hypothetical protein